MRRVFFVLGGTALALALWLGAFLMLNRPAIAQPRDVERRPEAGLPLAGDALDLVIWNIGYGGLGAGSDFVADGGVHYFPPSRRAVRENAAAIERFLASQSDADIVLIQELARGGPVNYWVDVRARADRALQGRDRTFFADFKTRLMPWPLRLVHGQGIYSRLAVSEADVVALPAEDAGIFGVRRRYAAPLVRLAGDANWTVVSVHLAAFDEDAQVRTRQLRELLAWAEGEYAQGRRVVIGGDWNFQLAETNFPHTTDERFLFWLFPFPEDALPPGWRIGADASVPSVRTNHKPYVAGENYVTTIDGFIVSPNVAIESVRGFDLGFQNTDHHPVRVRVRAIDEEGQ
jgi:endonuclease/exonuclease/phosphatase family metal-dependent hydrolase